MRNHLFLLLSQYRLFWQLRYWTIRICFWFSSHTFGTNYKLRDKKDNYLSFQHLIQITQIQLIVALVFSILLQLFDPILYDYYEILNLEIPDNGNYVTLLATISGIGGVFIGLYYAAVSTIGSSIYAKVPNNIRDLLAQERIGNVYMNFLSFITFLGISLVSFRVLGFDRIYLAIPLMVVASVR